MTSHGDICGCGDIALPAHDLCSGCLADLQAERERVSVEAARLTAEHEAQIEAQEAA